MCGRYASFRQSQDVADEFSIEVIDPAAESIEPSWNVAPTQNVRIVVERFVGPDGGRVEDGAALSESAVGGVGELAQGVAVRRELRLARWGLVPHWAKDPGVGNRMINARSETAAEKSSFRSAMTRRRCIVLADGYYEWRKPDPGSGRTAKTPFAIGRPGGEPLAFAGLYSWWKVPEGGVGSSPSASVDLDHPAVHDGWLLTCAILTRAAEGPMASIHDRVPVMLQPDAVDAWLDPRMQDSARATSLTALPLPELAWHEVGREVNAPRNDHPGLLVPVEGAEVGHT